MNGCVRLWHGLCAESCVQYRSQLVVVMDDDTIFPRVMFVNDDGVVSAARVPFKSLYPVDFRGVTA